MHPLVLRPFLVVLTLGMLVVALFQSVGRLGFMVLDDLELAANQWLSGQQIRLTGIEGSWRFLNPIVTVDRVDMPAGYLTDVVVELDWLESLVRNRFVARRFVVRHAQVGVERDASGRWRLVGATTESDFDPSGLLYHSDELSFAGLVTLRREDAEAPPPLRVDYTATNRGGIHRHQLHLNNAAVACTEPCRGHLEYQAQEGLWPFWEETRQLHVDVRNFRIPKAVLGASALNVVSLGTNWQQRGDHSGGHLKVNLDGLRLPTGVELAGDLTAQVQGELGVHQALIDHLELQQRTTHAAGDSDPVVVTKALRMPVVRVRTDPEIAQLWTPELDLGEVAAFLHGALQGRELARWLEELNIQAEVLNLRGYLRLATGEVGYAGTLAGLQLDGYRGAPYLRGGSGELFGFDHGIQLKLKGQDMELHFPETFTDRWQMPYMQGVVQAWIKGDYLGLRGLNLRAETPFSRISGGFAITRPESRYEQRLTLLVNVDAIEIAQAKTYVPYKISPGLADWIDQGLRAGLLSQTRFGYHGQTHLRPDELGRRVELSTRISDGRVQYHEDWPQVTDLAGDVAVMGQNVRVIVDHGVSATAQLAGSRVMLRDNAAYVDLDLDAQLGTQAALDFARDTPLREWLAFIAPDWAGAGELRLQGALNIPLGESADDPDADETGVDLTIALRGADLDMPEFRLTVNDLDGRVRYRYPNLLRGSDIKGTLFGHDLVLAADSDADTMTLRFEGHAGYEDVLGVIDLEDPGVFSGATDFVADLHIATNAEHVTRLDVTSDLQGLTMNLPAEFAKSAEEPRLLETSLQFLDDYQVVSFRHGSAQGWLQIDDVPVRGAVGFGQAPAVVDSRANHLLMTGRIEGFALEDVIPDDGDNSDALMSLRLVDLAVGHIDLDDFRVEEAVLNGDITDTGFTINVASDTVAGDLRADGDQPLLVVLEHVVFPESDEAEAEEDPLDVALIGELPEAVVEVARLRVGEIDYGRWRFEIEPQPEGVLLNNLEAELRGVQVLAPEGVMWSAQNNESRFRGELKAGNLADVLPLWDYAPSLETESASLSGDLRWPGSPANVDLDVLIGEASVRADQGRFVDVDSGGGAMRIFSLMNFNTIAKRMRGDFSDVTGKGVTFDKLRAKVAFDSGSLEFVEPMKVKGTGSSFEVAGTVDLVEGTLDNEMIVTLPVSKSLPWYAAYIAIANPLAGAGILVGERIMRKPIEQFSSAKYEIGGTLDEPELNLVSVFDTSMKEGEVVDGEDPAATAVDEGQLGREATVAPEVTQQVETTY